MSDLVLYTQLHQTHKKREELGDHLLREYDPEVSMLVVTGSDRIGHFGWEHWEDTEHEHHQKFLDYFSLVDATLEHFAGPLGPDDTLIVLSDHGMEAARLEVNLNAVLADAGFLKLGPDDSRKYDRILPESTAFALEDGRIYLHEEGRFPGGSVQPGEHDELLEQLAGCLSDLNVDGEPAVRTVYRREEIYHGENSTDAPHLVVVLESGLKPVGRLTEEIYQPSRLPGMHNDQAFLLVRGPDADRIDSDTPNVEDVASLTTR
jgi:predicted AlkP superfamily phosphohydrolase/phosphomutase